MSTDQIKERLRGFGITFEKSLEDLIKGIRSCNNDQDKLTQFFESSIQECRQELKSSDLELKSTSILKLSYLEMYGYDMSWCSFHILEIMSSSKFQLKRIGYLAAIQILQRQNNDDALMLMTNLLKKDLNSSNYLDNSLAISGIASVVSTELAMDIVDDMSKLLSHSKPLIRKKAVLAMYKIFLKYPESLRTYYERLVDKLDDSDSSVSSATVNVICELAHGNPSNYIELIPTLFGLMKMTNNNWMVIRLLKLFAHLSLSEPRLKNKLMPEIKELMKITPSLSIAYECINSILDGNMLSSQDFETADLIISKLMAFFNNDDQNLKFVGLLALIKTCRIHQEMIKKHDKLILSCIYDDDLTIREKSLEIINSLVTDKNIITIVSRLLVQLIPYNEQQKRLDDINNHLSESQYIGQQQGPIIVSDNYKLMLIKKIIEICSMDNYANIPNFKWYLGVLRDIIFLNEENKISDVDQIIGGQFSDIAIRVPSIRPRLVKMCIELCATPERTEEELTFFKNGLKDCIWIIGEYYVDYINWPSKNKEFPEGESDSDSNVESDADTDADDDLDDSDKYSAIDILKAISNQHYLTVLASSNIDTTMQIYVHSMMKLYTKFIITISGHGEYWIQPQFESARLLAALLIEWFGNFSSCANLVTQERSIGYIELLRLAIDCINNVSVEFNDENASVTVPAPGFLVIGLRKLFDSMEIKPVKKTAQLFVEIPIDLAETIEQVWDEDANSSFCNLYEKLKQEEKQVDFNDNDYEYYTGDDFTSNSFDAESMNDADEENARKIRLEKYKDDPFYIMDNGIRANENVPEQENHEDKIIKHKFKKPQKPKKIRMEKVLVLKDEDEGSPNPTESLETTEEYLEKDKSKMVDSRGLNQINLTEKQTHIETYDNGYEEYQVAGQVADLSLESPMPSVTQIEKRKKPKKVKKKRAVIE
ncbi:Apl5 protein [Martiniozyma asiatica (nom. inval.)]|nr:Apl5 protein [Martiniozyma asiatica]